MSSPITIEQIGKAARKLSQLRPPYAAMLAFYEDVFKSQEQAKSDIDLEPIRLSGEGLASRRQEELPLVDVSGLAFDKASSEGLLEQLCDLTATHATKMQSSAAAVTKAVARGDLHPQDLFHNLLQGNDAFFQRIGGQIGANASDLAFLAYNSMQPSIEICATQLASYLDGEIVWRKGYCPVCGSAPGLAVLGEEGQRFVSCSFCRHQWQAPRIFCVFCENTKTDELHYFYAEKEKDLRVDVCERCRQYIKTVDRRKISRPLFPPLEQVASLHLDMVAAEKGFSSGSGIDLEA